jgi:hypothetical protein
MTTATGTCWTDPLSRMERKELRLMLSRHCHRFWDAAWPAHDPAALLAIPADLGDSLLQTAAEMADLHLDVTERAEVPAS